jgi:hypothetical protein
MLYFVLARTDLLTIQRFDGAVTPGLWAITAFLGLGTIANLASRSSIERRIWTPIVALVFLLTGSLALF